MHRAAYNMAKEVVNSSLWLKRPPELFQEIMAKEVVNSSLFHKHVVLYVKSVIYAVMTRHL